MPAASCTSMHGEATGSAKQCVVAVQRLESVGDAARRAAPQGM